MNELPHDKVESAFRECQLHADILAEDLEEHGKPAYSVSSVHTLDKARMRLLDQMAYRFGKLQATLSEQILPALFERAEEPMAPDAPELKAAVLNQFVRGVATLLEFWQHVCRQAERLE